MTVCPLRKLRWVAIPTLAQPILDGTKAAQEYFAPRRIFGPRLGWHSQAPLECSLLTRSNEYTLRCAEDLPHVLDLLASLVPVKLVDTNLIDLKMTGRAMRAEIVQGFA